jgi:glycosyltransferase involved in cell wall biosynthesis
MRIAILLNEAYPVGMAATNRIHLYAKGLLEMGNEVRIFIPRPTEFHGKVKNTQVKGKHEGVFFQYACNPVKSSSFLKRRIQNVKAFVHFLSFFIRFNPDIILTVSNDFRDTLFAKVCSIMVRSKMVREKNEVPFHRLNEVSEMRKRKIIAEFKLFHGIIVISDTLRDFFTSDLSMKVKILEVPILIDSRKQVSSSQDKVTILPNLVYTGSLINRKDGILSILEAFSEIAGAYPDVRLVMTGDINGSPDKEKILDYLESHNLRARVDLVGYVSKEELMRLTSTATALLLAKPDNRQNRYNMATKVGEYLLTGRPVVLSSVDPVCTQLTHRVDAFIVRPDGGEFAEELRFILDNAGKAAEIGSAGQKKAYQLFDYKVHAARMNDYLKAL